MAEVKNNTKSQYWCAKIYDDSANPHWRDILDLMSIRAIVSPLHNQDKITKGSRYGETVKAHRHIILDYGSPVAFARFKEDCLNLQFDCSPDVNICKIAEKNLPRALTYLLHKTRDCISKGKVIYNEDDLEFFGDFDLSDYQRSYQEYLDMTEDDFNYFIEIIQYIKTHKMIYYNELVDMCIKDNNFEWLRYIRKSAHATVITSYMRGMEYQNKQTTV